MNTRFVRSSRRFRLTAIIALCLLALAGVTSFALNRSGHGQKDPTAIAYEDYEEDEDPLAEAVASLMDTAKSLHGTIDTITYEQSYEGTTYTKQAYVYVPASYASDKPANILYLTHGWWGNAAGLASGVAPVVDELETAGKAAPTLVVFATYYPDRSFATDDYEDDYALNRFFATTEIDTLIDTIESRYTTFARGDTSDHHPGAGGLHRRGRFTVLRQVPQAERSLFCAG